MLLLASKNNHLRIAVTTPSTRVLQMVRRIALMRKPPSSNVPASGETSPPMELIHLSVAELALEFFDPCDDDRRLKAA